MNENPKKIEKPEENLGFLGVIHHFLTTSKDERSEGAKKNTRKTKKPASKRQPKLDRRTTK